MFPGNSGDASFPIRFWDDGTLSGEGSDKDGDYTIKGRLKWHHDRKMYWNLFETLFLDLTTMNHKFLSYRAFSNDVTLFWCPNTMKRRPCWCPKPILWELKLFLCEKLSFVPINLQSCWPRKQTLYSLFHPGLVLRNDLFNKKKIIFLPLNSFLDFLTSFLWSTKYLFKKDKNFAWSLPYRPQK